MTANIGCHLERILMQKCLFECSQCSVHSSDHEGQTIVYQNSSTNEAVDNKWVHDKRSIILHFIWLM